MVVFRTAESVFWKDICLKAFLLIESLFWRLHTWYFILSNCFASFRKIKNCKQTAQIKKEFGILQLQTIAHCHLSCILTSTWRLILSLYHAHDIKDLINTLWLIIAWIHFHIVLFHCPLSLMHWFYCLHSAWIWGFMLIWQHMIHIIS